MELHNNKWVRVFRGAMLAHEEGARILLSHCHPGSASRLCGEVIYLSGYVVECALKAALFSWTPVSRHAKLVEAMKKAGGPGHSLVRLRELLVRTGCPIRSDVTEAIASLAGLWKTEMRYDGGSFYYEDAEFMYQAAKVACDWIVEKKR
jgi:hypothetical protein